MGAVKCLACVLASSQALPLLRPLQPVVLTTGIRTMAQHGAKLAVLMSSHFPLVLGTVPPMTPSLTAARLPMAVKRLACASANLLLHPRLLLPLPYLRLNSGIQITIHHGA